MAEGNALLQQTYGYSAADVETNRGGEFTAAQQQRIDVEQSYIRASADAYSKTSPRLVVLLVALLVLAVGTTYVFFGDALKQIFADLGTLALPVIGGVVLLLVLLLWYAQRSAQESMAMYRAMGDPIASKPTIRAIEGRVELVREEARTRSVNRSLLDRGRVTQTYFYAKVRGSYDIAKISIPEKDTNPFEPQRTYRIFYADSYGTKQFLSAELVN